MSSIPWVRGLRRPNQNYIDEWKKQLTNILLGEEHKISTGKNTKKSEKNLRLKASRYWYIGTYHETFGQAVMIWYLKDSFECKLDHKKHFNCGGVCPCDTGGIVHDHNTSTANCTEHEKLTYFCQINMPIGSYQKWFTGMLKTTGISRYINPTISPNNREQKWEGRIEVNKIKSHIDFRFIYLSFSDQQILIAYIRDSAHMTQRQKNLAISLLINSTVEIPFATTAIPMISEKIKEQLISVS